MGFDESEEEDDAEWEQDKEREAEDVSKEDVHAGEQCKDGTRIAKISDGVKDLFCKAFDQHFKDGSSKAKCKTRIILNSGYI